MPRNFKITIAYDGTDFCGWQVQPSRPSIQGTLADAIERITRERVLPQGSGRTDAGVHALAQVASFALESAIPAENLLVALNNILPASIRINSAEEVAAHFHARHSASAKTYEYRISRQSICPPFLARYVHHHPYPLNEDAMMSAAKFVVGKSGDEVRFVDKLHAARLHLLVSLVNVGYFEVNDRGSHFGLLGPVQHQANSSAVEECDVAGGKEVFDAQLVAVKASCALH